MHPYEYAIQVLQGLHINKEQVQIYAKLSDIPALQGVRVFTAMIPTGTRIPGTAWNCSEGELSQLALEAHVSRKYRQPDAVKELLKTYGLDKHFMNFFYAPDSKLEGVELSAGKGRGIVSDKEVSIDHVVTLHLFPRMRKKI